MSRSAIHCRIHSRRDCASEALARSDWESERPWVGVEAELLGKDEVSGAKYMMSVYSCDT